MALITYTTPYLGGPSFYTGTSSSSELVPEVFPGRVERSPVHAGFGVGQVCPCV